MTRLESHIDSMDSNLRVSSVHEISHAKNWSGLPFPTPIPDLGIQLASPALAGGFFTTESPVRQDTIFVSLLYTHLKYFLCLFYLSRTREMC